MREEFLKELEEALNEKDVANKDEILAKYRKRYDFGRESGLSDSEIEEMLGSIDEIVNMNKKESYEDSKEEFKEKTGDVKVNISTVADDVFFERSKDDLVHIYLKNISEEYYEIVKNEKMIDIQYINKKFFGLNRRKPGEITVALPSGMLLGDITLSSVSGDFNSDIALVGRYLNIDMVSGDSKFKDIHVNDLRMHVVSGDLEIESVNSKSVEISSVSGDVEIEDLNTTKLKVDTISGDIDIDNANEDIIINTDSISGAIMINGNKYKNFSSKMKEAFKKWA